MPAFVASTRVTLQEPQHTRAPRKERCHLKPIQNKRKPYEYMLYICYIYYIYVLFNHICTHVCIYICYMCLFHDLSWFHSVFMLDIQMHLERGTQSHYHTQRLVRRDLRQRRPSFLSKWRTWRAMLQLSRVPSKVFTAVYSLKTSKKPIHLHIITHVTYYINDYILI